IHFSCFLVTANTNKAASKTSPIANDVGIALMAALKKDDAYFWRTLAGWVRSSTGSSNQLVQRFQLAPHVELSDEVGSIRKRQHCHGLLVIAHRGWIRLNR